MGRVDHDSVAAPAIRIAALVAAGSGLAFALLAWAVAGWVPALLIALAAVGAARGLWRGVAAVVGALAGLVVAALVAEPLGRGIEGTVGSALRLSGFVGRLVAIGLAGAGVMAVVSGLSTYAAKRFLRPRPHLARVNHWVGGVIGLFEGALLGVLLLWIPVAAEPVAAARLAAERTTEEGAAPPTSGPRGGLAGAVMGLAADVRHSSVGRAALAVSPAPDARIFRISEQFVRVMNDDDATADLLGSPVVQRIDELPSFQDARRRVMADPALRGIIESGSVTSGNLRLILESPVVLDVLDHTTVAADLAPLAEELMAAVEHADGVLVEKRRRGG